MAPIEDELNDDRWAQLGSDDSFSDSEGERNEILVRELGDFLIPQRIDGLLERDSQRDPQEVMEELVRREMQRRVDIFSAFPTEARL